MNNRQHVSNQAALALVNLKEGRYVEAHRTLNDACNFATRQHLGTEQELARLHRSVGLVAACFPGNNQVNEEARQVLRELVRSWGEGANLEPLRYGVRQVGVQERFVPETVADLLQRAACEIRESRRVPGVIRIELPREEGLETFEARVEWTTP